MRLESLPSLRLTKKELKQTRDAAYEEVLEKGYLTPEDVKKLKNEDRGPLAKRVLMDTAYWIGYLAVSPVIGAKIIYDVIKEEQKDHLAETHPQNKKL